MQAEVTASEQAELKNSEQSFENDESSEDTLKDKYLTFSIEQEEYAIEIRYVTEIVGMQNIAHVPDMPPFVKGVLNLRGRVIPVMDVRLRFGLAARAYDERTCVVVANVGDSLVGFVVDAVREVCSLPASDVSPAPHVAGDDRRRYIRGIARVGDGVKFLVDIEKLVLEYDGGSSEPKGAPN
jgi:purine-binding chemotaxis protein CheW